MLGAKLTLHDVADAEALCVHVVQTSGLDLSWHQREDLTAYLITECWTLSRRYEPGGRTSFSTFATYALRRRVVDWRRRTFGRTVWKFHDHTHVRERPQLVSLDELDSVGDVDAGVAGDSPADRFASLGGLVTAGGGETNRDLRLIRRLVS
jgi:DNA-directed RNA polymerase specialized sigma24 family protein